MNIGHEVTLVLRGDESARSCDESEACEHKQTGVDQRDEGRRANELSDKRAVARGDAFENAIESAKQPSEQSVQKFRRKILRRPVGLQQQCRQGRAERDRVEGRNHRGHADRHRELQVELARDAGDERRRHEDSDEHEGDGDNGTEHLVHRLAGGIARRKPGVEIPFDVLHHHDGIIDHDADGQHQAEERNVVQREPERGHRGECPDERHRHGNERYDGRPPCLQEKQHDENDQDHRLEQRVDDRTDRFFDELRRVINNAVFETVGEPLREIGHQRAHRLGRGQGIAAGLLVNREPGRRNAVERRVHRVVARTEFGASHIAEAHHLAAFPLLDDDLLELLRRHQPPLRVDRVLEGIGNRRGRAAYDAGSHLHVLLSHRIDHIAGLEPPCSQLLRLQPEPHAVFVAEDRHLTHAGHARQRVLKLQQAVIAQIQFVEPAGRGNQVDHHHHRRRLLLHLHARAAHVFGQQRKREVHAVLREHLRRVEVGSELERDRQPVAAVAVGARRHVEHVLDAVDLLLDGCADRLGHRPRIRAGVNRRHLDRRRGDFRILRDRQYRERHEADHHDDDRQHRGEDRPVDEEMADIHRGLGVSDGRYGSGLTFKPGRAFINPSTMTRSPGAMSPVIARVPSSCSAPAVTRR